MNDKGFQLLAYITGEKSRVIGGASIALFEKDEELRSLLSVDLAKAMKCDVVQLKNKDYLLIKNR
ncbi:capping complex subunit for YIEGIA [Paraclostridium sordellii]|uniref:Uncharacterized protein n=1 Tax=Paraclostridium sordellii TaxID=1505 RepID=A0A9P1L1J9_PARSO|nr:MULTISPECIES: hypothetical protein [Paeniclostridium]EPZ62654.1 hypothetical protein H477_5224 [[Clostridium] sordellii ATCC 9714] [Paeniclostridium sordellii ATCC 9714]EPZ55928.1 hypothetical protein H476_2529 [[Clostridium] sordellii VPI 9048] [Paeniclostridium sordellii VPI 9048]MBS6024666.1 hypothetical protein [Paeniclostridium sordellii]MBW4863701.1 hypothetical protein [Paeniclostridium sp.]MBW4873648.1 hypothetical protein [Paeniclostridium sp.]